MPKILHSRAKSSPPQGGIRADRAIDLRDNGGGDDAFGKILFAHLIDKPFQYYAALEVKKKEFEFLKYTDIPPERQNSSKVASKTIPEYPVAPKIEDLLANRDTVLEFALELAGCPPTAT